jgi:polysaccharide biosynthesis/export protein
MHGPMAIIRAACLAAGLTVAAANVAAAQQGSVGDPLRPGDVLRVRIFQEPEMSGEFPVDERGAVTLPRLGALPVASWPADSIRPRLTRAFGEYLRDPVMEVTVLRRISVTGSVLRPGLYPVDPSMTVMEALALAGGASPDGRRDRVELRRGSTRSLASLDRRSLIADLRLRSGDQLFVPQRGWLSRNTWLVSTLISASATVVTIRLTR